MPIDDNPFKNYWRSPYQGFPARPAAPTTMHITTQSPDRGDVQISVTLDRISRMLDESTEREMDLNEQLAKVERKLRKRERRFKKVAIGHRVELGNERDQVEKLQYVLSKKDETIDFLAGEVERLGAIIDAGPRPLKAGDKVRVIRETAAQLGGRLREGQKGVIHNIGSFPVAGRVWGSGFEKYPWANVTFEGAWETNTVKLEDLALVEAAE